MPCVKEKGHFFYLSGTLDGNPAQPLFEMDHKSKNEDDLELG